MFGIRSARRRALVASTVMLVLLGTVGGVATWRTHSDRSTLNVVDQRLAVVTELDNARAYTLVSAVQFAAAVLTDGPTSLEDTFSDAGTTVYQNLRDSRENLAAMGDEEESARLDGVIAQVNQWQSETSTFINASGASSQDERLRIAEQYIPALWPQFKNTMSELEQLSNEQQTQLANETAAAGRSVDRSLALIIGLTGIAFLTAIGTMTLVSSVIRPLQALERVAKAVATGNLDVRARTEGPQEVASLARALNVMVEKRQQAEEALIQLAATDSLTGLYNHRSLHDILDREIQRSVTNGRPLSIIMMDIDGFKLFNDTYGHQEGDRLLKQVADVLRRQFDERVVVGRYGGDEFMAILSGIDRKTAAQYSTGLLDALTKERVRPHRGGDLPIVLSIGLALCPEDSQHKEELIAYADSSLFEAKQLLGASLIVAHGEPGDVISRQRTPFGVLDALVRAVDRKDRYTRRHSQQNAEYACALGKRMGLSDGAVNALRIGGLLHDVGKIGVPDDILKKPGALTEEEMRIMRDHVVLSNLIVHGVPNLQDVSDAVYSHHERWDGTGYPRGLKGEDIPLPGRIMALVDAYSAMILDRPYRKALSYEEAVAEIRAGGGTQFDPGLVEPFLEIIETEAEVAA
jgi:diguanylate cyclase (GGDEF)-like protein